MLNKIDPESVKNLLESICKAIIFYNSVPNRTTMAIYVSLVNSLKKIVELPKYATLNRYPFHKKLSSSRVSEVVKHEPVVIIL